VPGAHYALAAFPLRVQESIIGTFVICSLEEEAFDASEVEILAETAEDLAYGIGALRTRIEHEQAFRHIQHMLYHDSLTDLPNHAFLVEHVDRTVPGASRHQGPLALLLIGLSRFQEINGVLGFAQGDILLREVTTRLHGQLDSGDLLVRMRGDEFAVLLPLTSEAQLIARALQILEVIGEPFALEGLPIVIGAAIGIAHAQLDGEPAADLIRHADIAMHQAKQQHKDYVVYTSRDDEDSTRNLAMAGELRHAIRAGQLVLHYQPKIDMASGTPCGAEALVRWIHPAHGLIPPDEFVPMAERIGLINVLTDWVIAAILQQSAAWRTQGIALPIAANLSVRNLQDQEFPRRLDTLLEAHRAAPDWLDFEITESAVMEDPHTTLQTLDALSKRGHALSIDDFGTGYSSLSYLQKMPVNSAKIDKSFVFNMLQSSDSAAIVRATILLAHDLKLGVVAEGVETQAMWDELARLGCDVAQGYFISRPVPAEEFTQFMARHAVG
jgi:diguanylate cyclase (GGDEF)-like protein